MKQNDKIVFMVSADHGDNAPLVILGIPKGAWDYMKDGKTHTFDLTKAGVPVKPLLFGAADHDDAIKILGDAAARNGITLSDERGKDWGLPK